VSRVITRPDLRRVSLASTPVGAWILVLCWALIILVLILQPGADEPGLRRLRITATTVGHAVFFAALALLAAHALFRLGVRRAVWWAVVLTILFGIGCEVLQVDVPGRTASVGDLVADILGAWAGAGAFGYVAARHPEFRLPTRSPRPAIPLPVNDRVAAPSSEHG
jgi:VanZ family protein